jgi:uncharacterized protein (DUF433 family)
VVVPPPWERQEAGLRSRWQRLRVCEDGLEGYDLSMNNEHPTVSCSPEVMGGTPVFSGTRVPVQTVLDYLEAGETIDDFLEGFPSVRREQVIAFLEEAKDLLVAKVS